MKDGFYSDFEDAIEYLHKDSNLSILEKVVENYLSSNQDLSISKFVNFQLEFSQLTQQHIGVLFHYFKQNVNINYQGKNKEVFRRLENLKRRIFLHLVSIQGAISTPNRLKGTLFTYNDLNPFDLAMTLMKFDNSYFTLDLDINTGINLATQIIENFSNKLNQGTNNIDVNQLKDLTTKFENFSTLTQQIIHESEAKDSE